eukprot:722252-Pyramimonas_sp.AAC.1
MKAARALGQRGDPADSARPARGPTPGGTAPSPPPPPPLRYTNVTPRSATHEQRYTNVTPRSATREQ